MNTRRGRGPAYLRDLPTLVVATTAMYLGGALMLGVALLAWSPGNNPRWLLGTLAVAAAACAVFALVRRTRFTRSQALVMVTLQVGVVAGLSWRTDVDVAALTNGAVLPIIGAYASWLLHPVAGRAVVYTGALCWAAVVLGRGEQALTSGVLSTLLQTVLAAEAFGLLHRRVDRLTHTDPLTGLLNRRGIVESAEQELSRARRRGRPLCVAMIDIDGLREVNNRSGHGAGDDLIRAVTASWAELADRGWRIGRVGGDEFVMVLPGLVEDLARELLAEAAARSPYDWTAGVAQAGPGETFEEVLDRADQAMYAAKPPSD
ncbi:GGDEF domain-containing protein [Nocardioides humi]|uniref:GGDEF domain-containing protein n=1 Tax=Nocardioides humi TaxID=449461 RepID=A0ABN2BRF0_9ACTN|nr:GGDEF domain-containing protein [Nocardioides humi]